MVTEWVVVLEAPCSRPVCHISACGAWWCGQLILFVAVVVATEPSDVIIVTAAEGHHDECGPIKSDFNANISLDFASYSSLCDGDAAFFKKDRKLCFNTIHLWRDRERERERERERMCGTETKCLLILYWWFNIAIAHKRWTLDILEIQCHTWVKRNAL